MFTDIITIIICLVIIALRLLAIALCVASLIFSWYNMSHNPPKWLENAYDFLENLFWWG